MLNESTYSLALLILQKCTALELLFEVNTSEQMGPNFKQKFQEFFLQTLWEGCLHSGVIQLLFCLCWDFHSLDWCIFLVLCGESWSFAFSPSKCALVSWGVQEDCLRRSRHIPRVQSDEEGHFPFISTFFHCKTFDGNKWPRWVLQSESECL